MPIPSRLRALALVAVLASIPFATFAADALPRLLGPTQATLAARGAGDVTAVRERAVRPDVGAIDAIARHHLATREGTRFLVDLFPGLELEAEVISAEVRTSGTTVFAKLVDVELGSVQLTLEHGVLVGTVDFPGGNYTIDAAHDGSYRVAQRATQFMPRELEPRARFTPGAQQDLAEPDVPLDSGRLIDVMIVWPTQVETLAGGAAAMQAKARASIDNANITYLNSGVAQRLRLVHAQAVTYTERATCPTGNNKFDCALDDITDGLVPNVHALRDLHGADLVSFFIADRTYCGLAWLPNPSAGTARYGYSVLEWDGCPVANKSFVHELGHNMGAHHDTFVASGPGAFAYSHGMVDVVGLWRTVLSYPNQCSTCARIQYLSNPRINYNGRPMGDAALRNNAHTLNKTAKAIAAYRPTSSLHPVPSRFTDVAASHPNFGHIEFFAQAGFTSGCTTGLFCPNGNVTRRQMAVFLERAIRASNWTPPAAAGLFTDVPAGAPFRDHVEALRNDGITSGCTSSTYCPDAAVTRAQMAVFLLRARCGSTYVPNAPATPTFTDVPATHPFYAQIQKLYALGITSGCGTSPARFCPDAPVTRAQMAVFVERAYPFLAPTEACAL